VTERDLSRKVSDNDASSKNTILQDVISSPLVTIDYISQVAKDIEKSKNYEIRVEGEVKQMIEEKMRFCKQSFILKEYLQYWNKGFGPNIPQEALYTYVFARRTDS
jgi:hypothetical protein